jgi:hypothetical protein
MSARAPIPHILILAAGFALSAVAALGLFGPYRGWGGQTRTEQLVVLFLFPITATVIFVLLGSLLRRPLAPDDDRSTDAAVQGIVGWIMAFLIGVHILMISVIVGFEAVMPWAQRGVVVLLGLVLLPIGNLLPRTRPNLALGIRTPRTLTDRRLWMLTHRVTGYIVVAIGLVTLASGAVLSGTTVAAAPFISALAGATIVAGFYWRVRASTVR